MLSSLASVWALTGESAPPMAPARIAAQDPCEWPALWARCWSRIRSWHVPPGWSQRDWWDEARAHGALAAYEALRAFDPGRLVPLEAFLYRRVVDAVWTRYRQEWSFGRHCRPDASLPDRPAAKSDRPDPERLGRLGALLEALDEGERRLICRLFRDGRSEDELALELGITRQAVNKRKQKLLLRLRSELRLQGEA